ncbi:MAG: CDP-glycerol glycerophosphotransferase family protein [Oscillospiraceae bacterium]|nr:CDP-glycerol glycerophosphotransferase family protein [Oscillospiraceae bacterium]
MRNKLKRLPVYLKNVFLLIMLWPVAAVLRKTNKAYRHLWLVMERGFDARDNAYWFFRYLRERQPQINACYVIDKASPDYCKVTQLGETVAWRSLRHYLMYMAADLLIGTHVQPAAPDLMAYYHLRQIGIHPQGKQIFLQHGIILNDMKWMSYPSMKVDFFASGGKLEYDYLVSEFGFPEGIIQYTGLCRFDNLIRENNPSNEILVMPTWRGWKYPQGERFYETAFYRQFQSMLENPRLLKLLEEHDLRLFFYPHIELQKELDKFKSPSERVVLASWKEYDVQTLLMRCNLLITDYSSVFFDIGYLEKPVIYYQFDMEEFRKYHYQEGYFSYEKHGFGPVVKTEEELMNAVYECVGNDFRIQKEYRDRLDDFYSVRDELNCERTYQILCRMDSGK